MNTAIVSPLVDSSADSITIQEMDVTPELAQIWLGLNTSNRKLKPAQVIAFSDDMKAGRWVLNGETVKLSGSVDRPRKLLDGQNRLHAVLKAGIPVRLLVVFGVKEEAQGTMDSGTKRTVADNLTIAGVQNATIVAAAASVAMRVVSGRLGGGQLTTTNAAAEEFIGDHLTELSVSAEIARKYARKTDVQPSVVAYTHFMLSKIDMDQATAFWRDASEKVGLESGDPVIALTNKFAEARRNKTRLSLAASLSAVYRAWNYRRSGKSMRLVKFNSNATRGGLVDIPQPK